MKFLLKLSVFLIFFSTFAFSYTTDHGKPVLYEVFKGLDGNDYIIADHQPYQDLHGKLHFLDDDGSKKTAHSHSPLSRNFDRFKSNRNKKMKSASTLDFPQLDLFEDTDVCNPDKKEQQSKHGMAESFRKSNCHPVIMVPGIMGTRLQIIMDDCSNVDAEILSKCKVCTPGKEWMLWLIDSKWTSEPSAIVHGENGCFGALASFSMPFNKRPSNRNGITVTWYGNTPESRKESKCGFSAIDTISSDRLNDFGKMIDYFEMMGYVKGVSMFAMPYDWRRRAGDNDVHRNMKRTLNFINQLYGKKTIIITHSFGSLNTLQVLNGLTFEEKSRFIERWIPIGPPFAGAVEAIKKVIVGTNEFQRDPTQASTIGYHMIELRPVLATLPGLWDLLPKNIYADQTEPWKSALAKTMENEQEKTDFTFYPSPEQSCGDIVGKCSMHLINYFTKPVFVDDHNKKSYMVQDIPQLLLDHSLLAENEKNLEEEQQESSIKERVNKLIAHIRENRLDEEINPEVPVTLIFGSQVASVSDLYSKVPVKKLRAETNKASDEFRHEEFKINRHAKGDGTVPVNGALVPVLKWAFEFEEQTKTQQKNPHFFPMQIVEHCSEPTSISYPSFLIKKKTLKKDFSVIRMLYAIHQKHMLHPLRISIEVYLVNYKAIHTQVWLETHISSNFWLLCLKTRLHQKVKN